MSNPLPQGAKRISLVKALERRTNPEGGKTQLFTQQGIADRVGLTQGSIGKMLRTERNVFVVIDGEDVTLIEEKLIATSKKNNDESLQGQGAIA